MPDQESLRRDNHRDPGKQVHRSLLSGTHLKLKTQNRQVAKGRDTLRKAASVHEDCEKECAGESRAPND
jgi:hypothetical protein